jgi:(1->4)-alpha-D-glucan 1-alpha-D-glucosylmutase
MREDFDFDAAAAIVPYLERLGVSHLYCSPYMQAAPHSTHGYDVVDPTRISPELGGERGLASLDAALRAASMGQLLDIVPNHMCIADRGNRWWWEVLRYGRDSPYAAMFDIDWDAPALRNRVLLPVLHDSQANVLRNGGFTVVDGRDEFELEYEGSRFPLAPGTATSTGLATAALLDAQHYVLEHWLTAGALINYRRFFDVTSLAGLRVENPAVFSATLSRALELVDDGIVDGLRIDHIDGLAAPDDFAQRLRGEAPDAWIVAEKILAMDERLPEWPVDGTTGYEFGAVVGTTFAHRAGVTALNDFYREFTGDQLDFAAHSHAARLDVLERLLDAELGRLTRVATAAGLPPARVEIAELLSAMPVYRLYPRGDDRLGPDDMGALEAAEGGARQSGRCDAARLSALVAALRGDGGSSAAYAEFRTRFQQVAGAVMAKGVEDTTFYRYVPLVALNEVGSEPGRTGGVADFHAFCARGTAGHPQSLLATATHDTKRGEDARLRALLIAEIPELWRDTVERLHVLAERHRRGSAPSLKAEYLLYQTLVAAAPIDADRMWPYMQKACREAKEETEWLVPDEAYEAGLDHFVRGMVADDDVASEIEHILAALTPHWHHLALSQTLLKLTAPGVPDIYQGCELWDLRLVDPDNRAPVDYQVRHELLRVVSDNPDDAFLSRLDEGLPKLRLIATALAVRKRHAEAFAPGAGYQPLVVQGSRSDHAICFARTNPSGEAAILTVALRWPVSLAGDWADTKVQIPSGSWRNALTGDVTTGGERRLAELVTEAPVALFEPT